MRMANEIKVLFLPGKDKKPWRIPCDFQIRETEITVFRILLPSHLLPFLRLVLCFSRFVPCGVLEGHRRIISPWSERIDGGLHVGCSLSRCIQMINYKYRSELGGCEGGRDRRRKGSLENYSRHAARKKRIYEWDVPSHWCRCGRLVPALISSKFNWV